MKKVLVATTIVNKETDFFFLKNISLFKNLGYQVISIINTNRIDLIKNDKTNYYYETGDLVESRNNLINISLKYNADCYFILDSDLLFKNANTIEKALKYKQKYDLISLYYEEESPLPAFMTLAGSLNDFYNFKVYKKNGFKIKHFFDDTIFNSSSYMSFNHVINNPNLEVVLNGKSFARKITPFVFKENENDFCSGGSTIYFNKEALKFQDRNWPKYNGKSVKWYDSYRIKIIAKKIRYAKVPLYISHIRFDNQILLSWDEVIRYYIGLNIFEDHKNVKAHEEHLIQLYFFIKGMIKKIKLIDILQKENSIIENISNFMNIEIMKIIDKIKRGSCEKEKKLCKQN